MQIEQPETTWKCYYVPFVDNFIFQLNISDELREERHCEHNVVSISFQDPVCFLSKVRHKM